MFFKNILTFHRSTNLCHSYRFERIWSLFLLYCQKTRNIIWWYWCFNQFITFGFVIFTLLVPVFLWPMSNIKGLLKFHIVRTLCWCKLCHSLFSGKFIFLHVIYIDTRRSDSNSSCCFYKWLFCSPTIPNTGKYLHDSLSIYFLTIKNLVFFIWIASV